MAHADHKLKVKNCILLLFSSIDSVIVCRRVYIGVGGEEGRKSERKDIIPQGRQAESFEQPQVSFLSLHT